MPLIENVVKSLILAGVTDIIINLHHFPGQIRKFLASKNFFDIQIEFSVEKELLDTGGGLCKTANFFDMDKPFILHNVDVLSNIDLRMMYDLHDQRNSLATLAVQKRVTSRYLIFDEENNLCGWKSLKDNVTIMKGSPKGVTSDLAFCGIHIISPRIFTNISEKGAFSIINTYLRLSSEGEKISSFRADAFVWKDYGKLEQISQK